jgi:hypothetical protein
MVEAGGILVGRHPTKEGHMSSGEEPVNGLLAMQMYQLGILRSHLSGLAWNAAQDNDLEREVQLGNLARELDRVVTMLAETRGESDETLALVALHYIGSRALALCRESRILTVWEALAGVPVGR